MSALRPKSVVLVGMVALLLGLVGMELRAEGNALAKEDLACLTCHDKPGLEKKLESGEILSLQKVIAIDQASA